MLIKLVGGFIDKIVRTKICYVNNKIGNNSCRQC